MRDLITPETIVGYRCSNPRCDVNFLATELVEGLIPKHPRNNLDEKFDCDGSLKEGVALTACDVPKVRAFQFL